MTPAPTLWFHPASNTRVCLEAPTPDMIVLDDIFYSLAGQNRYNGPTPPRIPPPEHSFNPNSSEARGRTARTLAEEHSALREVAAQLLDRAAVSAVKGAAFELSVLKGAPEGLGKTAIREALRRFGGPRSVSFIHIERLWGLRSEEHTSELQ